MNAILKQLRNERKLTQRQLAKLLNLSPSTIAMYETGQRKPDFQILQKIADFFDVSTDYLLGRTDIRNLYKEIVLKESKASYTLDVGDLSKEDIAKVKEYVDLLRQKDSFGKGVDRK
ncbi:MAG: helix-turn-helix domain-containing protein [Maledivibacter sp.]|jgi:transcriptional regulator with XRE-family HTH domain|nr:helix-turn-helix domain-containing protein [Maledivibacter sp.]